MSDIHSPAGNAARSGINGCVADQFRAGAQPAMPAIAIVPVIIKLLAETELAGLKINLPCFMG